MSAKFVLTFSSVGITILNVTGNHLWQIRMLLLYGKEKENRQHKAEAK